MLNIGFIGAGAHARELKLMFKNVNIYDYDYNHDDLSKFVSQCDGVVIASPSYTHTNYLQRLDELNYKGHIYCEKPICQTTIDYDILRTIDLSRVTFSFPLRESAAKDVKELISKYKNNVGLIVVNITHAAAVAPHFHLTWRADITRQPLGPLEASTIHIIDLFTHMFGKSYETKHVLTRILNKGTAPDDALTVMKFKTEFGDIVVRIHSSYASSVETILKIITHDKQFDDYFFIRGKAHNDYTNGLRICVDKFLDRIKENSLTPIFETEQMFITVEEMLK